MLSGNIASPSHPSPRRLLKTKGLALVPEDRLGHFKRLNVGPDRVHAVEHYPFFTGVGSDRHRRPLTRMDIITAEQFSDE